MPWNWDTRIQKMFDALGITWEVLPPGVCIPEDTTSPGDCVYDGDKIVFESSCPIEWVVHELAHWLVCRKDRPEALQTINYGYEGTVGDFDAVEDESAAANLTCWLLREMVPDRVLWVWAADYMNVYDTEICRGKYMDLPQTHPHFVELVRRLGEDSAPYVVGLPLQP
jgi:hypothetical protein